LITRNVADRERLYDVGMPGMRITIENVPDVVTVTDITRCLPGQLVATGVEQSLAVGVVFEKTPASVAHWQLRDAAAVTEGVSTEASAVDCIIAVFALWAIVALPYCAPARAAFVSDVDM
jgi:hypothetical protein